jgi:hypothetical protein
MTYSKRQPYGFGSFVKKFTRPVKKVAKKVWKSPLGKAALLGGGLYGLGSLAGGGGGWGNFSKLGSMVKGAFGKEQLLGQLLRTKDKATGKYGNFSLGKLGLAGLLGAGVAMPFMGGDEEEEIIEEPWENTPASIANITAMARARDPSLSFLPQNAYTQSGFYAADGGLAKLANGGGVAEAQAEQMLKMEYQKYRNQGGTMSYQQFKMTVLKQAQGQGPMAQEHLQRAAQGGRIGLQWGGPPGGGDPGMRGTGQSYGSSYGPGRDTAWSPGVGGTQHIPTHQPVVTPDRGNKKSDRVNTILENVDAGNKLKNFATTGNPVDLLKINPLLLGGSWAWNKFRNKKQDDDQASLTSGNNLSGIEGQTAFTRDSSKDQRLRTLHNQVTEGLFMNDADKKEYQDLLQEDKEQTTEPKTYFSAQGGRVGRAEGGIMDLGGMEKDYRQEGGFVPLGKKEKADDVPARLSKNEFVFTADAVRNAGGGDIDAGAEVMQNMMNNLEEGGEISEESQGAQGMYNQQQMLQSRMA